MEETLPVVNKNKWKAPTARIPQLTSRSGNLNTASEQGELTPTMLKSAKDGTLNAGTGENNLLKTQPSPATQVPDWLIGTVFPGEFFTLAAALSGMLKNAVTCPVYLACGTVKGQSYLSMCISTYRGGNKYTPSYLYVRIVTLHENVNFKCELLFMKEPVKLTRRDLHFKSQNLKFN